MFIYNMFPRLYGDIRNWRTPVVRAALMGFDWVYINPIHFPGFSGSLYAPKEYYRFNPLFFGARSEKESEKAFQEWVQFCHNQGVKVMVDFVNNHTAIDSPLVEEHPGWYKRKADGSVKSPGAKDGDNYIEWGDLAELDYLGSGKEDGLWKYFLDLATWFLKLGVDGFRCDAAYQVPVEFWEFLIGRLKRRKKRPVFLAESLGCEFEDVIALTESGFDYVMDSSKWWDFRADWCLSQHNRLSSVASTVAFPENHDTQRLASELDGNRELVRLRYLLSIFMGTGVMITSGFEYGYRKKCDVLKHTPSDRETIKDYLVPYIREANRIKKSVSALKRDLPIEKIEWGEVIALVQKSGKSVAVLIFNRSHSQPGRIDRGELEKLAGKLGALKEVTSGQNADSLDDEIGPQGYRLLVR